MALLSDVDRDRVRAALAALPSPVRLLFFTQTIGCESCGPTRRILDEIVALSDRISLEEYNFVLDTDKTAEYGIDKVPAIAVLSDRDAGIRFYGAPAGYEFASLLDAITIVSTGESGLSDESRALIAAVDKPIDLQVFVTPT